MQQIQQGSRNLAGVVVNTGIPFKALRETALYLAAIGIQMNGTFQPFIDACSNFPSFAELYKYATYDAMKRKQQGRVQARPRCLTP